MELKEFVSETLKEIISGVKNAQAFAQENGACINPNNSGHLQPLSTYWIWETGLFQ